MNCVYCYLPNRQDKARMSLATVRASIAFLRTVPRVDGDLDVMWHSGEPLLMSQEFYRQAFAAFAEEEKYRAHQVLQTNGTLIDPEWCKLFETWNVRIGVSVDGPRLLNDRTRLDWSGRSTFDRTMKGIAMLRDHGIPFSLLGVVSRSSLHQVDELWEFYSSLGAMEIGLNVEEAEASHAISSLASTEAEDEFREFIGKLYAKAKLRPDVVVREIANTRAAILASPGSQGTRADNQAGEIVTIGVSGSVSTYSPELAGFPNPQYANFDWGNVHCDTWSDILSRPGFLRAYNEVRAGVARCRNECGYFAVCGGGCPGNKLAELGTFDASETAHCRLHVKAVVNTLLQDLEAEYGTADP